MHSQTFPRAISHPPVVPKTVSNVTELSCQLQDAIAVGNTGLAALLASQLSQQRAPVVIQKSGSDTSDGLRLKVYIEDRDTDAGYVYVTVFPSMSIKALKHKVFHALGFPPETQNWIINRTIREDCEILCDVMELVPGCSVFLYLTTSRSVGLTRRGFEEKYFPESSITVGSSGYRDDSASIQRSQSYPQSPSNHSSAQNPTSSQNRGPHQGPGSPHSSTSGQGHGYKENQVPNSSPNTFQGYLKSHVSKQGQNLSHDHVPNRGHSQFQSDDVQFPKEGSNQYGAHPMNRREFERHLGQNAASSYNHVQNQGHISSQISPVISRIQQGLWPATNQQGDDRWLCSLCTLVNTAQSVICEACENPQPVSFTGYQR